MYDFSPYSRNSDTNLDIMLKDMELIQDLCEAKDDADAVRKVETGLKSLYRYMESSTETGYHTKLSTIVLESIRSLAVEHSLVKDASEIDKLVKTRTSFVDYLNSNGYRKPQADDSIYSIPTDDDL